MTIDRIYTELSWKWRVIGLESNGDGTHKRVTLHSKLPDRTTAQRKATAAAIVHKCPVVRSKDALKGIKLKEPRGKRNRRNIGTEVREGGCLSAWNGGNLPSGCQRPSLLNPHDLTLTERRIRNPANVTSLARLLERSKGWPNGLPPVFVLSEGEVVDGHHRVLAARQANVGVAALIMDANAFHTLVYDRGWPTDSAVKKLTGWTYPPDKKRPKGERNRRNIGTKQRTDRPTFKPVPWPNYPSDADDSYCPIHDEHYRNFKSGVSYEDAAAYLRDHGGAVGQGWDLNQTANHGDVLRLMGVLKTNAWRERHGYCTFDHPERPIRKSDPSTWGIPSERPTADLICFPAKGKPKCILGTRRKPTGKGRPPAGGADCRETLSGKYTDQCAPGKTKPTPKRRKK